MKGLLWCKNYNLVVVCCRCFYFVGCVGSDDGVGVFCLGVGVGLGVLVWRRLCLWLKGYFLVIVFESNKLKIVEIRSNGVFMFLMCKNYWRMDRFVGNYSCWLLELVYLEKGIFEDY